MYTPIVVNDFVPFRVREKITLQSIALRFGSDLVDLIELNR